MAGRAWCCRSHLFIFNYLVVVIIRVVKMTGSKTTQKMGLLAVLQWDICMTLMELGWPFHCGAISFLGCGILWMWNEMEQQGCTPHCSLFSSEDRMWLSSPNSWCYDFLVITITWNCEQKNKQKANNINLSPCTLLCHGIISIKEQKKEKRFRPLELFFGWDVGKNETWG